MSAEELVAFAQQELRCIDWQSITKNLMSGAVCGADCETLKGDFYSLSRFVRQGETVDYFLSHSWHDDEDAKWERLNEVVLHFISRHERDPTFWLDKVCIDQCRIADGLKALPVYVMSCRYVLVLCGNTYARRLWCMWELYTLFSFGREDCALERIVFEPFGPDQGAEAIQRLRNYRIEDSRCFDPNEEQKIKSIIWAIGAKEFNDKMCRLAASVADTKTGESTGGGWLRRRCMTVRCSTIGALTFRTTSTDSDEEEEDVPIPKTHEEIRCGPAMQRTNSWIVSSVDQRTYVRAVDVYCLNLSV